MTAREVRDAAAQVLADATESQRLELIRLLVETKRGEPTRLAVQRWADQVVRRKAVDPSAWRDLWRQVDDVLATVRRLWRRPKV